MHGRQQMRHAAAEILARHRGAAASGAGPVWLELERAGTRWSCTDAGDGPRGLYGRVASQRADAVAVVAGARLRPVDPDCELAADLAPARHGGAILACVVAREGGIGWRMELPGGGVLDEAPDEGVVLDTLLRALGLPTAAPASSTAQLVACAWTAALLRHSQGRRLSWPEAATVPAPLPSPGPGSTTAFLPEGSAELPSWECLRVAVAAGGEAPWAPPARISAWMDDGMFSRHVVAGLPPPGRLMAWARPALSADAARRLHRLIGRI